LWFPRKVAVMRTNSKFVVCDRGNERSRMQIFTKNGHYIKKIAIRYIDIVAGLAVTNQGHIVAVDSVSPTVFIISEDGDLVHWFDCSDHMREPSDIAISGELYFCHLKKIKINLNFFCIKIQATIFMCATSKVIALQFSVKRDNLKQELEARRSHASQMELIFLMLVTF
jgi:hypothetical protein